MEKKGILSLFTRTATNKTLKTTASFIYFLSAEKFSQDSYLIKCLVFLLANILLAPKQPGFRPSDSFINQILSSAHEVRSSFDDGLEVRSIFLNIPKAFEKVWHGRIIFKLKQNSILDNLLNIFPKK